MNFVLDSGDILSSSSNCLVIGIQQEGELTGSAKQADEQTEGLISQVIASEDFKGKKGEKYTLFSPTGFSGKRLILIGLGKDELTEAGFIAAANAAAEAIKSTSTDSAALFIAEADVKNRDNNWKVEQTVLAIESSNYVFDELKSEKAPATKLESIRLHVDGANETSITQAKATAKGMALTKTLGNLPGNVCTPTYLADKALELANTSDKLSVTILDEKEMSELGMGSLLSVSRGSEEPAKLIVMEYKNAGDDQPNVLVGKGITFDTGGISLKPGAGMDEMKWDMCGAGSVFGAMQAIIDIEPKANIIGVVAAAENMPSGKATKPGDIVTTMSGTTVEILNTDAEGRLVLCDALTYVEKFNPKTVIDIATLTGACVVALGNHPSAVYSNDEALGEAIVSSGLSAWDRVWPMPLWDEYQEELDSNFADIANIGSRWGGSITAACFLSRFTKKYKWAHLDIAGTAWNSAGKQKGSTGRPVPLLVNYLLNNV
ncbi:leucyl aminopeptidase [Litoribrevibacter albus]|uniref:Probable cytosol aminopeptidase n=1 Tax=Litoribrevibacter albus TaxID=1473156 RepID=A0AA37SCH1_9GAMM|nr:leucyl aminopeptidase [Litoribrevibacter albus]GLQ32091.1 cytosol aminopeptidase [Litoribrevibacter albus]